MDGRMVWRMAQVSMCLLVAELQLHEIKTLR